MAIRTVPTQPFADQSPGTSGLRKRVTVYPAAALPRELRAGDARRRATSARRDARRRRRRALLQPRGDPDRAEDGRGESAWAGCSWAAAGILSTPAASCLIRERGADGGIILSASHNPGGPDGDFGVKYNLANGGPAPEHVTSAIAKRTREITEYRIADAPDVPLDREGEHQLERHAGGGDRSGRGLRGADGAAVRLRRDPRAADRRAVSACGSTRCTRSPGPTPARSSSGGSARRTGR